MKTKISLKKVQTRVAAIKGTMMALMMALFTSITFSQTTVVDIIVGSPDHTTLEAAVIAAELADDLTGEGPFTVFAPTDAAFAALPAGTVETLLKDPTGDLASILLYHVVGASAKSTDLSNGQKIVTLNGSEVTASISDGNVYIDKAMVITADIETDNGVIHVIDAVIIPTANTDEMADAGSSSGCQ